MIIVVLLKTFKSPLNAKKAKRKTFRIINTNFFSSFLSEKINIYKFLFNLCISIWGYTVFGHFNNLKILQNRYLKYLLLQKPSLYPIKFLYPDILLSVSQLVKYESILFIFKCYSTLLKHNCDFYSNVNLTDYNTKSGQNLRLPGFRKRYAQSSVFYECRKLFTNFRHLKLNWKSIFIKHVKEFNWFNIKSNYCQCKSLCFAYCGLGGCHFYLSF